MHGHEAVNGGQVQNNVLIFRTDALNVSVCVLREYEAKGWGCYLNSGNVLFP